MIWCFYDLEIYSVWAIQVSGRFKYAGIALRIYAGIALRIESFWGFNIRAI